MQKVNVKPFPFLPSFFIIEPALTRNRSLKKEMLKTYLLIVITYYFDTPPHCDTKLSFTDILVIESKEQKDKIMNWCPSHLLWFKGSRKKGIFLVAQPQGLPSFLPAFLPSFLFFFLLLFRNSLR